MENKNNTVIQYIIGTIIIVALTIVAIRKPNDMVSPPIEHNCKKDSLQLVISDLRGTLEMEENGWDSKEARYENIIEEYEFMMGYLHDYHIEAYKDIHRVTGMKEKYSREVERENKTRLKFVK